MQQIYYAQFYQWSNTKWSQAEHKLKKVTPFLIEILGSDGVFTLDGRNCIDVMINNCKQRILKLSKIRKVSAFEIRKGTFSRYEVIYSARNKISALMLEQGQFAAFSIEDKMPQKYKAKLLSLYRKRKQYIRFDTQYTNCYLFVKIYDILRFDEPLQNIGFSGSQVEFLGLNKLQYKDIFVWGQNENQ